MKLVCDACGAKYSIGDDRVAGKVFKIRCKKCSQVMVVRGTAVETHAVSARHAAIGDDWHVVLEGAQAGPFSRGEIQRRRAAGELDDDSFMWREGMDEWVAYGALVELRGETTRLEPTPRSTETHSWTDGARSQVGEPQRPAEAPRAALLNERNESSVLFTLGNLARLASSPAKTSTATATAMPGTEGSGLIDIRALASTFSSKGFAPSVSAVGTIDDLPAYGPSTFGEPLVLVPTRARRPDRKLLYALIATLAMIAVLGVVLVFVMLRDSTPAQAAAPQPPPQIAIGQPTQVTPTPTTPTPAVPISTPPTVPTAPAAPTQKSPLRRTTPTPRPTPSLVVKEPENKCTEVSCAYSGYVEKCCEVWKPQSTTPTMPTSKAAALGLPDNLDKDALKAGIATIRAQACGGKSSARGDVSVSVKISADGAVTAVTIKSSPDQALSTCVISAAQKGSFAKTKRGGTFSYLWRF